MMIPYSTNNQAVIQSAENFTKNLLSFAQETGNVLNDCKKYPDELILHLYAAVVYLYGQTKEKEQLAVQHISQAKQFISQANTREKQLLKALEFQIQQNYQQAIDQYFQINQEYPEDLLITKLAEFCFFCLGQSFESQQYLNYTLYLYPYHTSNSDFLGMHSFANELCGHYHDAEKYAEQAIQLNEHNAWAHHTLSHIFINQKKIAQGRQVLTSYIPSWKKSDPTIYSHNLWHYALFYLEELDFQAMEIYLNEYGTTIPDDLVCTNVDMISLLWRMELAGKDMTSYWPVVANKIIHYASEQFVPFLNAHFFYALGRANELDKLSEAMESYSSYAKQQTGFYHRNWSEVGSGTITGYYCFYSK